MSKEIDDIACNPVGKARIIVNTMTNDSLKANELLGIITHILTGEEINKFYDELKKNSNQLKLDL